MPRQAWLALLAVALAGCEHHRLPGLTSLNAESYQGISLVVAGQSNALSYSGGGPAVASQTGHVTISDRQFSGIPTTANPTSTSITWVYLGDWLYATYAKDVRVHNLGKGSTTTEDWRTNAFNMRADLSAAIASDHPTAVLWVQGESDCYAHFTADQTYKNMREIITTAPRARWFVAIDGLHCQEQRQAQEHIISDGLARPGPDVDTLRSVPAWNIWDADFYGQGLEEHAKLWIEIFKHTSIEAGY